LPKSGAKVIQKIEIWGLEAENFSILGVFIWFWTQNRPPNHFFSPKHPRFAQVLL